jgi:hypothetical protein
LLRALLAVLFPPLAPLDRSMDDPGASLWWRTVCALSVIPLTAIAHHAVFYRPRCMLNDFGPEYTPKVVADWLSRDPSLPWAILCAIAIYAAGVRWQPVRFAAAPLFLAFLPLSLWIWDIPFSGRWICHHGHDKRPLPGLDIVIRTRYLYLLGGAVYAIALATLIAGRPRPSREASSQRQSRQPVRSTP